MKKIFIIILSLVCLKVSAQNQFIFGNFFEEIQNYKRGWLGASNTDTVGYFDSLKVKLFKPILPGSYTTSGSPDATLFGGYIIWNTDSLKHQYSNGTSWLTLPGTGGGGGGSGTVTSFAFTDGSGFDGTVTNSTTTPTLALTTSLTTGSVPYIGASGALSQNNANLFWDNTNVRLGIGTATPAERLHVYRDANVLALMQFQNPNAGNTAGGGIKLSTDGGDTYIYRTSIAYATSGLGDATVFQENGGGAFIWYTSNEKMRLTNAGNVGIGISPSRTLDVFHGSAAQIRLSQASTTSYSEIFGTGGNFYLGGSAVTNTLVALGGSTSSFPAIQRNGANTRSRLADNSADTDHEVADEVYDATAWNGSLEVPTKNAIRDKIETLAAPTTIYTGDGTLSGNRTVTMSGSTLNFTGGNVGLSTTGPDRKLDILDAAAAQLRLTHTDGTTYSDLQTNSSGYLDITPTGRYVSVPAGASTVRGYLPAIIWSNTSTSATSGTTETDLYGTTTLASTLGADGEWLEWTVDGAVDGTGGGTHTLRVYWAGTEVFEGASTVSPTAEYQIRVRIYRTSSTNARVAVSVYGGGFALNASGSNNNPVITNVTTTFSNTNVLKVTGTVTNASSFINNQGGGLMWNPAVGTGS